MVPLSPHQPHCHCVRHCDDHRNRVPDVGGVTPSGAGGVGGEASQNYFWVILVLFIMPEIVISERANRRVGWNHLRGVKSE